MSFFRRDPHIPERSIHGLGTTNEMYLLECSCGWAVQDYNAREVELTWGEHLNQHKVLLEAQMQEIAREFQAEFGGQLV